MCLDIDRNSVIHKHLKQKLIGLNNQGSYGRFQSLGVTILPSFHISLGKPPSYEDLMVTDDKTKVHKELISSVNNRSHSATSREYTPLIGEIALAPINISKQNNKKSAWIPLNTEWLNYVIGLYHDINLNQFKCYDVPLGKSTKKQLHVSLANLTGNPRDSIARPEDCIIDTITV